MGGQTRCHTEKDLEVSQEAKQEQVGLKGSLGGETSRVRIYVLCGRRPDGNSAPSANAGLDGHLSEPRASRGRASQ